METEIYLDTNVVIWLAGAPQQLSSTAKGIIDTHDTLLYSPMVDLELEYLYETGRIQLPALDVLDHLRGVLNIQACERSFSTVGVGPYLRNRVSWNPHKVRVLPSG